MMLISDPTLVRDVLTEPPTCFLIVEDAMLPHTTTPTDECFLVPQSAVEVTDGWRQRNSNNNNSSTHTPHGGVLSICFMHSFGKCSGRVAGDPSSCHQIHIQSSYLRHLRPHYTKPLRRHFFRTLRVRIPLEWASLTRNLKYFEFRPSDVTLSQGLTQYEGEYRHWLQQDTAVVGMVFHSMIALCRAFSAYGKCVSGESCPHVHAPLHAATTRDRRLLEDIQHLEAQLQQQQQHQWQTASFSVPYQPTPSPSGAVYGGHPPALPTSLLSTSPHPHLLNEVPLNHPGTTTTHHTHHPHPHHQTFTHSTTAPPPTVLVYHLPSLPPSSSNPPANITQASHPHTSTTTATHFHTAVPPPQQFQPNRFATPMWQ